MSGARPRPARPRAAHRGVALVRRRLLALLPVLFTLPRAGRALEEVPYVKTPDAVVDAILDLARVGPADVLYDLGSGDGRIVIAAAVRHGTRGIGVEIDPVLVQLSTERARAAGVADRARFVQQDLFETDFSGASVVTMYLLPDVNLALRPKLLAALRPGSRVVSHDWDLGDWQPERTIVVPVPEKPVGLEKSSRLMLWVVPANVDGSWRGQTNAGPQGAAPLEVAVTQRFQQLSVQVVVDGRRASGEGRVDGSAVSFATGAGADAMRFAGELRGGRIEGSAAIGAARGRFSLERVSPSTG